MSKDDMTDCSTAFWLELGEGEGWSKRARASLLVRLMSSDLRTCGDVMGGQEW